MRSIKVSFMALLSLTGLFIIISTLLPDKYRVERSILIEASLPAVFEQINDFNNMQHWSPWLDYDPFMKTNIEGNPGQSGYTYSWDSRSKKLGKGSLTRISAETDKYIHNMLILEDYGMTSKEEWFLKNTGSKVELTWANSGKISFAFRIPASLMSMEKMIAPDFDKGLKRIREYCESMAVSKADTLDEKK